MKQVTSRPLTNFQRKKLILKASRSAQSEYALDQALLKILEGDYHGTKKRLV